MVANQVERTRGVLPESLDLISGRAVSNGSELGVVTIEVESGFITDVHSGHLRGALAVPSDWLVAPGLVDLQVNGIGGIHLAAEPERLGEVAQLLPQSGVTTFLATLPSATRNELDALSGVMDAASANSNWVRSAEPIGIHLEGPAISPVRAGAHPTERVREPAEILDYLESSWIQLLTLAPELRGADELTECAKSRGISLAAGHTDGTYEDGRAAIDAGIELLTHTFNAMRPLTHRSPGLVGAYLEDLSTTVCVIADGAHVSPAVVSLLWRLKGPQNLAFVSDAIALTPSGTSGEDQRDGFDSADRRSPPLVGGTRNLADGLEHLCELGCAPLPNLLDAASAVPAKAVGISGRGSLSQGNTADIIAIDQNGHLQATWCRGQLAWSSSGQHLAAPD